jgi:hypothetical protein
MKVFMRLSQQKKNTGRGATLPANQGRQPLEAGQALLILAISFVALLAFIGLVTDAGSLYITYTQLKRAIDAAAVAAANNVKIATPGEPYSMRKQRVTEAAREMLSLHNITNLSLMEVYLCDDATRPADFNAMCPPPGDPPRKLAYVKAVQEAPVYFLRLFGIQNVPFSTSAVGEAATVDLVLVLDTSESMASDINCGSDSSCTPGYDPNNFNPAACNAANNCYPLRQAKDAAAALIARLLPGYDQVAIVHYDYQAHHIFGLSSDIPAAIAAVGTIGVHNDAPAALLPWSGVSPMGGYRMFNPIFPDDRDGNGNDGDGGALCVDVIDYRTGLAGKDLWDDTNGEPCDDDNIRDAYDWNNNGIYTDDDTDPVGGTHEDTSQVSTCIGCGMHLATEVLRGGGRPASVWVIVFLSDGIANLSDTHQTNPAIPGSYQYGFCGDTPGTSFWNTYCIDWNPTPRHCIDTPSNECPPGTTHTNDSGPYSVLDYAYDMVDEAALLESTNPNEPTGEDTVIYSVGLGAAQAQPEVLRYMANLGDDGLRDPATDPCINQGTGNPLPATQNCGNYYYAPTGAYLDQIFESIASRIFTKISR